MPTLAGKSSARGPIAMATFSVKVMDRGYHVYQCVWIPIVGEELPCRKEYGNTMCLEYYVHNSIVIYNIFNYNNNCELNR